MADRRGRDAFAAVCREIVESGEGQDRLRREILKGGAESFWEGVNRAFGRAPAVVELESNAPMFGVLVLPDGTSDELLSFLAAANAEAHRQAKVASDRAESAAIDIAPVPQALPAGRPESDNQHSVNSVPPQNARPKRIF